MHRPELAILDEPTSGLDPLLQAEVRTLLRETAADGRTVFLSSHSLDEVQHTADRVGIIRVGPSDRRRPGRDAARTCPPPRVDRVRRSRRPPAVRRARRRATSRGPTSSSVAALGLRGRDGRRRQGRGAPPGRRSRLRARRSRGDLPRAVPGGRRCPLSSSAAGCSTTAGPSSPGALGVSAYVAPDRRDLPVDRELQELDKLVASYPDALKSLFGIGSGSLTSGAGFLDAELFSFMLPLFVLVLAIGSGARTLAGEEDAGRLELLLAYPLRRSRSVLVKGLAVAAEVGLVCAAILVVVARARPRLRARPRVRKARRRGRRTRRDRRPLRLARPRGRCRRGEPYARPRVPAAAAAAGYLIAGLHELAGWLDPFRFLSSFWLVGSSPLQSGVDGWGVLVVVAAALVALAAAMLLFERRDLKCPSRRSRRRPCPAPPARPGRPRGARAGRGTGCS